MIIAKGIVGFFAFLPLAWATGCNESPENATQNGEKPATPRYDTVRVATFNVHRFFDAVCDTGTCGSGSYEPAVTQAAYQKQLDDIALAIWHIDADIVLLQEIEKESGLADLQEKLSSAVYPAYAFGECHYDASLDVGIIARGTIDGVEKYRDGFSHTDDSGKARKLSRELIRADITLKNNVRISAFTTHFVSRVSDAAGSRRLAEAVYTQKVIAGFVAQNPGRHVVFGGDLNDTPADAPVVAISDGGVLIRDAGDLDDAAVYTWNDEVAFDHLFHSQNLDAALTKTERVCNANPASGLGSSDHCALKSTYRFLRDSE